MDAEAKKIALRMIPYGIYVLTADDGKGNVGAATVNWVTQGSFAPPLVVVGVKADSGAHTVVKGTGRFALNMLGKDHKDIAFTFFKPAKVEGGKLSGQTFHAGTNGTPIRDRRGGVLNIADRRTGRSPHLRCRGDRGCRHEAAGGRADAAILEMKDLGDTVYYGG